MNKVELIGTLQAKTQKGNEAYKYWPAAEGKSAMLSFSVAIQEGSRQVYVRCSARGVNAELLHADLGKQVHVHGSVTSVKIKDSWQQQVFVSEVHAKAEDTQAPPLLPGR